MRFTIRNLLRLAVVLALLVAWLYCSQGLWIESPTPKHHPQRPPDEAISEYRQLLNGLY